MSLSGTKKRYVLGDKVHAVKWETQNDIHPKRAKGLLKFWTPLQMANETRNKNCTSKLSKASPTETKASPWNTCKPLTNKKKSYDISSTSAAKGEPSGQKEHHRVPLLNMSESISSLKLLPKQQSKSTHSIQETKDSRSLKRNVSMVLNKDKQSFLSIGDNKGEGEAQNKFTVSPKPKRYKNFQIDADLSTNTKKDNLNAMTGSDSSSVLELDDIETVYAVFPDGKLKEEPKLVKCGDSLSDLFTEEGTDDVYSEADFNDFQDIDLTIDPSSFSIVIDD